MAKLVVAGIVLLLMAAAGGYYYYLSPSAILKRTTQHALDDFSKAVGSKDRTRIDESLKRLLSDSANIRLEVSFSSVIDANAARPVIQEFDKAGFIAFIDNTLYSLSDYGYTAQLQYFKPSADRKTAAVTFASQEWADGMSYYAGTGVNMRFSSDTMCEGQVLFEEKHVLLDKAICRMQLHSSPQGR